MIPDIFTELSVILVVAAVLAYITSMLRQPLIVGYILAGIVAGPSVLNLITSTEMVHTLSQIGVALLLFLVGLTLNPKMIKDLGKIALIAGLGQIAITTAIGYAICIWLGFDPISALYLSVAITFSSTIIIMKLLSDGGQLHSLYGRMAMGILLVQDMVVVLILMFISSLSSGNALGDMLAKSMLSGIGLIFLLAFIAKQIFPLLDHKLQASTELLFLCSIAWCLAWASLFKVMGFSIEVGALLAGVALSITQYGPQISARVRPLRDFFVVLFFILLGSDMQFTALSTNQLWAAGLLSLFVLIGNPIIVMSIMRGLRFPKHAGFLAGVSLAQVSEFSIILILLGVKVGHIGSEISQLMTIIAIVTIGLSTYLIKYGDRLYEIAFPYLHIFDPKNERKVKKSPKKSFKAILFGYNRIGYDLIKPMEDLKGGAIVIDCNPQVVHELVDQKINCMYGDVEDVTLFKEINLKAPKLFVSTIPNYETSLNIIRQIKKVNKKAIIIVVAHQIADALIFYDEGASYVLLPHFVGGKYCANLIKKNKTHRTKFDKERKKQIKYLKDRLKRGHEHPVHETLG